MFLFQSVCGLSQTNIFIATDGNDSSGDGSMANPYKTIRKGCDQASPGDTVMVRAGTYKNSDYDDGDIWTGTYVTRIIIHGTADKYITIQPYDTEEVIIKFDGVYGFLIQEASYIRIKGFIFEGVADEISQQDADNAWGLYKTESGEVRDLEAEMKIDINDPSLIETTKNKPETLDISSSNMEIKEYGLVQESDNVYSGLLKTKYEDMTQTWDVRVIWDHSTDKYTVTWELTDEK